ncbi:N,N-dimethylformamidase beta subunit family domain-containing protein [Streptosporangium sp. NPDC002524]|uniref:N,N-dimethylformamidase beta subunit family domain-containing protein n=1 Tax=Streptosporangium sp. NPDC002524 TaxID=3154537 RepID=UPI00333438C3
MAHVPQTRLLAYLDRWSAAPGQHVTVHASGPAGAAEVELTDLVDQTALGPATPVTVEPRRIRTGSHLEAAGVPAPARGGVAVWLRPHERRDAGARQVVAELDTGGWRLLVTLDGTGHLDAVVETRSGSLRVRSGQALPCGSWSLLAAAWEAEPSGTRLRLAVRGGVRDDAAAHGADLPLPPATATLRLGAGAGHGDPYAGRLALPLLTTNALTPGDCDALAGLTTGPALARHLGAGLVALWDPAADPGAPAVPDVSGNGRHARAVNRPLAGLAGPGGDGTRSALQLSPEDLDDARWPRTCAVTVPAGTGSTVLGVRVRAGGDSYVVPLVVRPESPAGPAGPAGPARTAGPARPAAVVLPTFTYLAYANHRQSSEAEYFGDYSRVTDRGIELSGTDAYLNEHRELGLSLYDQRREGGPVYHSSGRRPVLNLTPGYRWWMTGAPRHFAADLLLLRWLRAEGFAFDVLTDEDVHAGGAALLARYRVVLTGSHPEYVSAPEREAVAAYVSGGGRLMYLGGNGFYWVTGVDPRHPHAIEVRRGRTGAWWDNEPGEDVLTSTGEPGGLWRERGLPPQELLGVGFAAQGWGPAPGFTRLPDSYRAEAAWVFDGVTEPVVGRHGLALGGAAGDEIDRADPGLGTPPGTLLLATSAGGHSGHYQNAPEEARLGADAVRADMTLRLTRAGGAVFAAGSINWVASLACCDGDVRRVTRNVLSRFLSPKPTEE